MVLDSQDILFWNALIHGLRKLHRSSLVSRVLSEMIHQRSAVAMPYIDRAYLTSGAVNALDLANWLLAYPLSSDKDAPRTGLFADEGREPKCTCDSKALFDHGCRCEYSKWKQSQRAG